ncbi:MAG: hypothetical protein KIS73_18125 [Enhydrobacter sp.]|nr:hypothetical protein [Enhydrobacter sp.]
MAQNEHLAAGNCILKPLLKRRPRLSNAERGVLGEIGHRLGRKVLADIATVTQPDAILGSYRKRVAHKLHRSNRGSWADAHGAIDRPAAVLPMKAVVDDVR